MQILNVRGVYIIIVIVIIIIWGVFALFSRVVAMKLKILCITSVIFLCGGVEKRELM